MTKRQAGFTLIELMMTVAIVAILARIAYPSYLQYIIRANRSAAEAQMMEIAFVVGTYLCLAFVLNSAGVQLDEDLDPSIAPAIPQRED